MVEMWKTKPIMQNLPIFLFAEPGQSRREWVIILAEGGCVYFLLVRTLLEGGFFMIYFLFGSGEEGEGKGAGCGWKMLSFLFRMKLKLWIKTLVHCTEQPDS